MTYKIRIVTDLIPGIQLRIPTIVANELRIFAILSGLFFIIIGIFKNLYELHKPVQKYVQTFSKVRVYWFITITFIAYFGQSFIFKGGISRFIIVLTGFLTFIGIFFFDQIRNYFEAKSHRNGKNKILIITSDLNGSFESIEKIKKGFSFKTELVTTSDAQEIDITKYFMIVAVGTFEKDKLQAIFERIRLSNTRFYHISEGYFLEDVVYTPENIDNIIALEYKHSKLDGWSIVLKRLFDIFTSLILIIITSPILIIISIIIKLDSQGPIFFKQNRVGKNGKLFGFLKFRSMIENAESMKQGLLEKNERIDGPLFKIKNDPRITHTGRFLRKTSLDELPQLFSVLIGTMSLVGPRPHLLQEVDNYKDRQKRLLSITPGITGYAQIFGRDNLSFDDEARLDLYYIQHRSILLDLYILLSTFKVVFSGK